MPHRSLEAAGKLHLLPLVLALTSCRANSMG